MVLGFEPSLDSSNATRATITLYHNIVVPPGFEPGLSFNSLSHFKGGRVANYTTGQYTFIL